MYYMFCGGRLGRPAYIIFGLLWSGAQEVPCELVGEEEEKVSRHLAREGGREPAEESSHPLLSQDVWTRGNLPF